MIEDMARKLPQFCYREVTIHGQVRYYFRRRKGKRTRLPEFASPEFWEAYTAALQGQGTKRTIRAGHGTLEWLIAMYRETSAYLELSQATRRQRDNIFAGVIRSAGASRYTTITKAVIVKGREKRAATPAQARNFLDAMRGLFRWAVDADLVAIDPTAGVKNPKRQKNAGFAVWTEDDASAYCKRWPVGTRERVWFEVLINTGLRRGDAVRLGRQHVRDGVATIQTEKTGMEVSIPLQSSFMALLREGPTGDLAFISGGKGLPLTKESFGNMFRESCNEAGVRKSAHGLRKLAATRVAEAGASVAELEAIFGWNGGGMASLYTRSVDRKRLARTGMEKLQNAHTPQIDGSAPQVRK
jgi:integrase